MKRTSPMLLAALAIGGMAQSFAHTIPLPEPPCVVILAPGSTWEYTFDDPGPNLSWTVETGGWSTGPAPFSNAVGGLFAQRTEWPAEDPFDFTDDLWVRTTFDLTGISDLSSIAWDIAIDNGFTLYLNGELVAAQNKEGDAHWWDYSGVFDQALLEPGENRIALALEDHGGGTAFDFQVGVYCEVPEVASSGLLLGCAFAGIAFLKRRHC